VPDVKMKVSRVLALKVALFYASAKGSCNCLPQSYSDQGAIPAFNWSNRERYLEG
jgi:hypothetical protein